MRRRKRQHQSQRMQQKIPDTVKTGSHECFKAAFAWILEDNVNAQISM
jgi:hypothetical protein